MKDKILCLTETKLKEEIELKKIGLRIRNINNEEIRAIKEKIENIYCSKEQKELYNRYIKAKQVDKNETDIDKIKEAIATYKDISNLESEKQYVFSYLERHDGKFDKKIVKSNLKNCIIIEVDKEKYRECFGNWETSNVVSRILNFSNYLGSKYPLKNYYMTIFESFNNYTYIINNYKYDTFDFEKLEKIAQVLNKMNINYNANYIFMIESFLINNISLENKIINMVSIVEKLLIKKNDNKQEAFKLKVGVLVDKEMGLEYNKLSLVLKTIYEVRSLLVHGEEDLIYDKINDYKKICENEKFLQINNKIELRYRVLQIVFEYLEHITKIVLNKYLDNIEFCEYLKSN